MFMRSLRLGRLASASGNLTKTCRLLYMEAKNSSPRILITGYMPFNSSFSDVSLKMYRFIQCFTGYLFLPRLQEVLGSLAEGLLKSYGKLMWHAVDLVFDLNSRRKTYGPISTVAWKLLFIVMVQMKVTLRTKMSHKWVIFEKFLLTRNIMVTVIFFYLGFRI